MRKIREIDFLVKQFADLFHCVKFVETYCWNVDTCNPKVMKVEHGREIPRIFFSPWSL